jgi:ADP-ribose pyrophosphatase
MMRNLPKNSKVVFEGVLFDVVQWEQEMFDGSTSTFEMIKRKPSTNVIAVQDDKIMVLEQEQPTKPLFPSLPGGQVDPGEKSIDAAKRELLEETGYESDDLILFEEYFGSPKIFFHEITYLTKNIHKKSEPKPDSGEKISVKFVDFDEFLQLCRKPNFAVAIGLKLMMYEALLDEKKKKELRKRILC